MNIKEELKLLTPEQCVLSAINSAERAGSELPEAKEAIQAAKDYLENPCEETRQAALAAYAAAAYAAHAANAAYAAKDDGAAHAANAAAYAARAAAYAAAEDADVAWAAAWTADWAASAAAYAASDADAHAALDNERKKQLEFLSQFK